MFPFKKKEELVPVIPPFLTTTPPGAFTLCSYCGGFFDKDSWPDQVGETYVMRVQYQDIERYLCASCLMRVFDHALRLPIDPRKNKKSTWEGGRKLSTIMSLKTP